MRTKEIFRWLLLLASGGLSAQLYAQSAQVSGQILDSLNSSVGTAAVTLRRSDTGDHRETISTSEGYYSFPLVQPGTYELKVEKTGFESYVRSGVIVQTGNVSTVDVTLNVGVVSQSVNVDADAPLLQS